MNGEQGETGERGERGATGHTGHTGHMGERGPMGDHGQDGQRGRTGDQGLPSKAFSKGIGTIFVAMLVVFLVLGVQIQRNQANIERAVDAACVQRQANAERTNTFYTGLIKIERQNPYRFTAPKTISERIKLYTDAMLIVPVCK